MKYSPFYIDYSLKIRVKTLGAYYSVAKQHNLTDVHWYCIVIAILCSTRMKILGGLEPEPLVKRIGKIL